MQLLVQRHPDPHRHAALHLARGGERIDDAAAVVGGDVLEDAQAPELDVDLDLDEVRGKRVARGALDPWLRRGGSDQHLIAGWLAPSP